MSGSSFPITDSQRSQLLTYLARGAGVIGLGFAAIFVRCAGAPGPVASFYRLAITVWYADEDLLAWSRALEQILRYY